jgi:hypothetical protein
MNADYEDFKYKELTEKIIKIFYRVYNELGYSFLEKEVKRKAFDNLRKQSSADIGGNLRPN